MGGTGFVTLFSKTLPVDPAVNMYPTLIKSGEDEGGEEEKRS